MTAPPRIVVARRPPRRKLNELRLHMLQYKTLTFISKELYPKRTRDVDKTRDTRSNKRSLGASETCLCE